MLLQYNLLDRANEAASPRAHELGMGVEVMGPVGGGRLGMPSEKLQTLVPGVASTAELALRFVLANPNVTIAFSGMSTEEQVRENCATAGREEPLSGEEVEAIEQALDENQRLAELYCTGCEYCLPCPQGVGIPQVFSAMNMHRVWGLTEHAQGHVRAPGPEENDKGQLQARRVHRVRPVRGEVPAEDPDHRAAQGDARGAQGLTAPTPPFGTPP